MKTHKALSRTEFRVLVGTAAAFWIFAWADQILLRHEWFSKRGLELFALSLVQPGIVILGTVLAAVAFQRITWWRQWDATQRVYKIVRFGILISAIFLSLLTAQAGVPRLVTGWYGWGFGIPYDWTLPFGVFLSGLCALGLVWLYPKRKMFVLASGLVAVGVGGALVMRYPPVIASLDAWWYEVLDSMRPWRDINESKVTIITMPEWPGENQFRRLTEVVVKSQPKVIGVLAPVYFHIAETGDTSFYSTLPTNLAVYGVMTDWYQRETYQTDFPVPRNVREQMDRGIITGVEPANPFSGSYVWGHSSSGTYDWETSYLPVFEANKRVAYDEESMDIGLAIVGKYLGISSPMPVTRSSSFWSSGVLHAAGRDIPLTSNGKVFINYPTRFALAYHWYRFERECYKSHFLMSLNPPSQTSGDTAFTLDWTTEWLAQRLGYQHWKERRYQIQDGSIVRYATEYLNGNVIRVDSLHMEGVPELHDKIVLITQQQSRMQWVAQDIMGTTYASIIQNLLDKDFITPLNDWWVTLLLLFTTSVVVLAFLRKKAVQALGIVVVSTVVCGFVLVALLSWLQVYVSAIPIIAPAAVALGLLFPFELARERRRLVEERVALSSELRAAHETQMGLMPTSDPAVLGFDISGLCKPAEEVGGDYFDYVWLDEEKTKLGIAVADVSGKAMKAAITAVMTSGMVYREVGTNETPKGILRKINRPIYLKTDKRIFTAMSFAVIDTKTKQMTFANAGQMQPLLKREGQIETLKVEGTRLPLGMAEDVEYNEMNVSLQSGDVVVFYTDGIPEAMNARNELFGFEPLESIVKESAPDLSAKQVAAKIADKVAEFMGPTKQHDDMTVVVVKVL